MKFSFLLSLFTITLAQAQHFHTPENKMVSKQGGMGGMPGKGGAGTWKPEYQPGPGKEFKEVTIDGSVHRVPVGMDIT